MTLLFDPDADVVRAFYTDEPVDGVAVPMADVTVTMSEDLASVLEIEIQDLTTFAKRFIADELFQEGLSGEALFNEIKPHIQVLMSLFTRNIGPIARDHVIKWDDLYSSMQSASEIKAKNNKR